MATELGKYLRKLRIDNDELMKTMAEKLGLASSTLSSIEAGRRNPSESFVEKVIEAYSLDETKAAALVDAFNRSKDEVALRIKGLPSQDQKLVVSFARKFADLSDEQKDEIRSVLESK